MLWELQLFLIILLMLLFQFKSTFQLTKEPQPITVAFFLVILLIIEAIFLLYFFLGERVIKKILLFFSISTTILVMLIIAFVANEGMHTFSHTNPVDFITGTEWKPYYQEDLFNTITLVTEVQPYHLTVSTNETDLYIQPYTTKHVHIYAKNSGGSTDHYQVHIPDIPTMSIKVQPVYFLLNTSESQQITLSITSTIETTVSCPVTITSLATAQNITFMLNITCTQHGVDITPDNILHHGHSQDADTIRPQLTIKNTGTTQDTYLITIQSPDIFTPSIEAEGIEWNYTTSSCQLTLQSNETITAILTPRLSYTGKEIEGAYILITTITSQLHPEIKDTNIFTFIYHDAPNIFDIDTPIKYISKNNSITYRLNIKTLSDETLQLQIQGINPRFSTRFHNQNTTLLTGEGTVEIETNTSEQINLFLTVTATDTAVTGDRQNLTITLLRSGTQPVFGILPFIVGTLATSFLAIFFAVPLALACAIYLSVYCRKRIAQFLRSLFELLAGIPSVIYGLWGFLVLGPILGNHIFPFFGQESLFGESILTASIILSIMILPIILTLSQDSIQAVKNELKEGSYALGATRWQTIRRIILPGAKSGIIASIILALGRAIGETMAVLMIMGPVTKMPHSILEPSGTMSSVIASTLGWGFNSDVIRHALFTVALILFIMIFLLNIIIYIIQKEKNQKSRKMRCLQEIKQKIIQLYETRKKEKTTASQKKNQFTIIEYINTPLQKEKNKKPSLFSKTITTSSKKALQQEKIIIIVLVGAVIFVASFFFFIIGDVIVKGGASLRFEYLIQREIHQPLGSGGFANAFIGSLLLVGIAIGFATPLALGAAIYTQEYVSSKNKLTKIVLFASDTLASTPSIVYGAFGFIFFVLYLRFGFSLLAGGLTLGIMIIPLMLRSSIEALKSIPNDYREGSYALGATKWQTIQHIILPPASPMISSGIIISIGRAIGETAAVMFTAGYTAHIVTSFLAPAASMPNLIYNYFQLGTKYPALAEKVYAAAFLLILLVLLLNSIAKIIAYRASRMMKH
ncbi:MAG: phosphate ABC transporter permease subunit PstC [Candidatus Thermoplasmatota archaeon]